MNPIDILLPAFAMFLLTMVCLIFMGFSRFKYVKARKVKISFFRTYNEGEQPQRLHLIGRHIQNHFEVPPLFYVGVVFSYISKNDLLITLIFAWLFFVARLAHTFVHLGSNNVSHRFMVFIFSLFCLIGLWASNFYVIYLG